MMTYNKEKTMNKNNTSKPTSTRTMRAMQITEFRKPLVLVDAPIISPRPDGALIRVEACGVCRSDWHFWNQDMELKLPAIPGHEVGGVVEEVGRDVKNIKVGDRVTIPFHESDGTCPQCRDGFPNLCDNAIMAPQKRPGGWAEYVTVVNADFNCIKLPDEVDMLSASALGCRYMTAYHAVIHQGKVKPGQWLAMQACGGIGLSAVQIAAVADALVVAVDIDDVKLARAKEEGAVATVNAKGLTPKQVGDAVKEATKGGAHISIDGLGRAFTLQQSLHSLRKRGRHVQVGVTTHEEKNGEVAIFVNDFVMNELEFVGSLGNPQPKYAELMELVARKKLQPARLVTKEISLKDVNDTLKRMDDYDTLGFEVITRFT